MTFYVGQKVTLKAPVEWTLVAGTGRAMDVHEPQFKEVVTVHSVFAWDNVNYVSFAEYSDGYRADWFRPVVERKTDISIFTRMLNPTDKPVTVGA